MTWGTFNGGNSSSVSSELSSGVTTIYSSSGAFAALKEDGSVVTWGGGWYGGVSNYVSSELSSGVTTIYSSDGAFAALKEDRSVVTWEICIMEAIQAMYPLNYLAVSAIYSTEKALLHLKKMAQL